MTLRFIDLFCGVGGFRYAAESLGWTCVFSSDIDPFARKAYALNFKEEPFGNIKTATGNDIPDFDFLFGGFPCQPFSISGLGKGFSDPRGDLIFEVVRILKAKQPQGFLLENVKGFRRYFKHIIPLMEEAGYYVEAKILSPHHIGVAEHRPRLWIEGKRMDKGNPTIQYLTPLQKIPPPIRSFCDFTVSRKPVPDDMIILDTPLKSVHHLLFAGGKSKKDRNPNKPLTSHDTSQSRCLYSIDGIFPCIIKENPPQLYFPDDRTIRKATIEEMQIGHGSCFDFTGFSYSAAAALIGNSVSPTLVSYILQHIMA